MEKIIRKTEEKFNIFCCLLPNAIKNIMKINKFKNNIKMWLT